MCSSHTINSLDIGPNQGGDHLQYPVSGWDTASDPHPDYRARLVSRLTINTKRTIANVISIPSLRAMYDAAEKLDSYHQLKLKN